MRENNLQNDEARSPKVSIGERGDMAASPLSAGRCVKFFEPIDVSLIEHRRETAGTSNSDEMFGKSSLD